MSYGKVKESFWTSKTVLSFSDDAKLLALYFITGPHRNIIGCMRVPNGYITEDLKWSMDRLNAALAVLLGSGWLRRDEDGWTLICNQLEHDPVKHTNHVTSAIALADAVPVDSPIFVAFRDKLKANLDAIGMGSRWDRRPIVAPEPSPSPEPSPEPEPDRYATADADAAPEVEAAIVAWNALASDLGLSVVQKATAPRKTALRARLAECGGLEGWGFALGKVRDSPFLRGENDRGWKADFDFILKPAKFTKLMEGGYDRKGTGSQSGNGLTGAAAALAELAGEAHG